MYTAIWPRAMAKKTRTRFCCWFLGPFVGLLQGLPFRTRYLLPGTTCQLSGIHYLITESTYLLRVLRHYICACAHDYTIIHFVNTLFYYMVRYHSSSSVSTHISSSSPFATTVSSGPRDETVSFNALQQPAAAAAPCPWKPVFFNTALPYA